MVQFDSHRWYSFTCRESQLGLVLHSLCLQSPQFVMTDRQISSDELGRIVGEFLVKKRSQQVFSTICITFPTHVFYTVVK